MNKQITFFIKPISIILLFLCIHTVSTYAQSNQPKQAADTIVINDAEELLFIEIYHGAKGLMLISDGTGEQEKIDLLKGTALEDALQNNILIANVLNNLAINGWKMSTMSGDNNVTRIFMKR